MKNCFNTKQAKAKKKFKNKVSIIWRKITIREERDKMENCTRLVKIREEQGLYFCNN